MHDGVLDTSAGLHGNLDRSFFHTVEVPERGGGPV
jgi:hypothetical protein